MERKILFYKDYFIDFYSVQEPKVQQKIEFVLDLVRFERQVPIKFFKRLKGSQGIYEIRVITTFRSIRILCFMEGADLVILVNSFIKKTQKTPRKEITLAEKLKKEFLKNYKG
ncbi:type II toxin-antitoxin system RelE/ParE family toxin [Flagellimonas algicola]|uniref:Type II toxin-antitoxin system RelE/ParE family toxin n=1 Tax=Flagellimonas algicola TaxID=2583815 RepID=A0ABY2WIL5_9FLAO|nr:type II toxin-antitoxin system RelE/ParE family toxin [Allomuricauda algicola]TMU51009.1 type II toxin-antitoxin system RelE/ParE family toxin [Allomuricauda algicola]